MTEPRYVVIMAGGSGTRLWPLSRHNRPKQMLALNGERTLFQLAVDRLEGIVDKDHILVVTVADQAHQLQSSLPEIPKENYLIEPMPRGTASVVGLAAVALKARDPQASMAVITADHLIENGALFRELLLAGFNVAKKGYLVTLGITPTAPETGYGYIQHGEYLGESNQLSYYQVKRFREKPDQETARQFLKAGDHLWNSGMFIWTVDNIWQEFKRSMPDLETKLETISRSWLTPERDEVVNTIWPQIKPESIDYGIMEKAPQVVVIPARDLQWSDVGSWQSLYEAIAHDEQGNVTIGADAIQIEAKNCLILSEQPQRLIVTVGVSDLVIVDTGDALLICKASESQKVREVVNAIKRNHQDQYL